MMITGYFDDTNSDPSQTVPMVAGYLASTFQWNLFNKRWAKLLDHHEVPIDPDFRQRISHRKKMHPDNTIFGNWIKNGHREPFLEEASRLIQRYVKVPIGNAVYRNEFEEIIPGSFKKMIGGPHGWCAYSTLHAIREYCDKINHRDMIRIVFEAGTKGQGQICKWYDELKNNMQQQKDFRLGGLSTGDKRTNPLQAADILAYALGRYATDHRAGNIRGSVAGHLHDVLGKKKPEHHRVVFWDREALEELVKKLSNKGLVGWYQPPG